MQSPKHREQYHKHKERKQEDESPTTTIEEERDEEKVEKQIGEITDPATLQPAVKSKKRVHYPQVNGEHSTADNSVKTDSLQKNHETNSGKRKTNKLRRNYSFVNLFSRSVFLNK